jgi:hypothetical protein
MQRNLFPILVRTTPAVRQAVGPDVNIVGGLALRAVLKSKRSLEIAHQQIKYRSHHLAFSSRIGVHGDLILELDVGDPRLADRVILEADYRKALAGNQRKPAGR